MKNSIRFGVNIDHVATVRNARGGNQPDPLRAAQIAIQAGADGITAHLREDRRHILDDDIERLKNELSVPLNMEMAATDEMVAIATRIKPHAVCLVPEKRQELTTEGGLNVVAGHTKIQQVVAALKESGIRVSLFIEANTAQIDAAVSVGAPVIELHTGTYCDNSGNKRAHELDRIKTSVTYANQLGLECHAGHGLNFDTVTPIAAISSLQELNIGHFLIGDAIFVGLEESVRHMRQLMDAARVDAL
jgi:pyridoxine 5-phosphate synthase